MAELDITTIATICLAIAAIVGIFFATNQYRHMVKQRRTEMLVRIYPVYNISPGELRLAEKLVVTSDFKEFSEFVSKYGAADSEGPVPVAFDKVGDYYEGIGLLMKRGLVDPDLVEALLGNKVICYWEKMLPFVKGLRERSGDTTTWEYYEYLYEEMKRRAIARKPA
jgi:hypothetical protein